MRQETMGDITNLVTPGTGNITNPNTAGIAGARNQIACTVLSLLGSCVTMLSISALLVAGIFGSVILTPIGVEAGCTFLDVAFNSMGFLMPFTFISAFTLMVGGVIILLILSMPAIGAPLLGFVCGLVVIWLFVSFAIAASYQIYDTHANWKLQKMAGEEGARLGVQEETFTLLRKNSLAQECKDSIKNLFLGAIGIIPTCATRYEETQIMEIMIPPIENSIAANATANTTKTTPGATAMTAATATTEATPKTETNVAIKAKNRDDAPNLKQLVAQSVNRTMKHYKLSENSQKKIASHIAAILAGLPMADANATIEGIATALDVKGNDKSSNEILEKQLLACKLVNENGGGNVIASFSINADYEQK